MNTVVSGMASLDMAAGAEESLFQGVIDKLPSLGIFYADYLFDPRQRVAALAASGGQRRLVLPLRSLLPCDWLYSPLVAAFQRFSSGGAPARLQDVVMVLQAAYFLMRAQVNWIPSMGADAHYCRLACVFLAGSYFFLLSYCWQLLSIKVYFIFAIRQ